MGEIPRWALGGGGRPLARLLTRLTLAPSPTERFGVQTISEFFASSEGNGSLFNYNSNKLGAGAVGHEGALATFARKTKQTIVKVDELTEEPARGPDGFCTRAAPNENGELVCLIDMTSPFEAFAGYYGNEAGTNKKILRDVFVKVSSR